MKNTKKHFLNSLTLMTLLMVTLGSCKKNQDKLTENAVYNTSESCLANDNWFPHSQTPAPEEGKGSPFDTTSTTNCIFHQWSWQKFLWLTKPEKNNLPLFLNQLVQVNDAMIPVSVPSGVNVVLTDTEQAGSNGILTVNPNYGDATEIVKDPTVYYSIHSDTIMLNAAKKFQADLASGKLPPNNEQTFPVGSLELKVSWIDINTIAATKLPNYFVTVANVSKDGGKTFVKKKMALLGMHVVGVVINHPEFIWATFEHQDLGPDYDWGANQASSSTEQLLFSKGTTTGLDGITFDKKPVIPNKAYHLFKYGVPKNSQNEYMQTSQAEPLNYDNIASINASVLAKLDDVWKNYAYQGSIWMNTDGLSPQQQAATITQLSDSIANATPGSVARGSLNNANLTMETYTQTFESTMDSIQVSNLANCFSCHNSESFSSGNPKSPLYLSHLFDAFIQNRQGKNRTEINKLKDSHQAKFVLKMRKK